MNDHERTAASTPKDEARRKLPNLFGTPRTLEGVQPGGPWSGDRLNRSQMAQKGKHAKGGKR